MAKKIDIKWLRDYIECQRWSWEAASKKFLDDYAKDPAYAFEWSQQTFQVAAASKVCCELQAWIDNFEKHAKATQEQFIEELTKHLTEQVMHKARWPERSTSVQSNAMSLALSAARAELLAKMSGRL